MGYILAAKQYTGEYLPRSNDLFSDYKPHTRQLLVGFVASFTLLVIFLVIIRTPDNHATLHAEMTMTGLLQLVWLLGRGSSAQDRIAEVNFPSTDNLREAAKFEVCVDTLVRQDDLGLRRRSESDESDEDLEMSRLGHDRI